MKRELEESKGSEEPTFIDHAKDALLESALGEDGEQGLERARQSFSVTDRGSAAWAAGKIAEAMNELERRKAQVAKYVADAQRRIDRLEWMWKEQLRVWAKDNIDHGKRSVRLPTATLQFRDTQARLEVIDEDAAKKFAIVNVPDAIETVEKLFMEPMAEYWKKNRIVPPGMKEVPAGESFNVKL